MFNVRVYGVLINEKQQILVSDEYIRGEYFTKFPGGGLEFGEGTRACLAREFMEEMHLNIEVMKHLYTTDFYQQSMLRPEDQIISIYYEVRALEEIKVPIRDQPFIFDEDQMEEYKKSQEIESFRFINWDDFNEHTVDLPIDKVVARLIKINQHLPSFTTGQFKLEDDRVRLEPLSVNHFDSLWSIASDSLLWRHSPKRIQTKEDFEAYFNLALEERKLHLSYPFAVFDKKSGKYAGCTRFGNISTQNKRLEIGWTWYGAEFHGTGLNHHCKFLMLSFAFETLGFNRVEFKTDENNLRSRRAIQKTGANYEGTFRNHMVNSDGTLRNSVWFSIIRQEWQQTKTSTFPDLHYSAEKNLKSA